MPQVRHSAKPPCLSRVPQVRHSAKPPCLCRVPPISHSAKRPPLPSVVGLTLGKEGGLCRVPSVRRSAKRPSPSIGAVRQLFFAEWFTGTRQRGLCSHRLCRVLFAEGYTWQRLCRVYMGICRVYMGICRVSQALGKEPESGRVPSYIRA